VRALICAVAGLALLAAGCGGGGDAPALPEGRFIATSQSITPRVQLFADPVVARVDVIVDRDHFDPELVRVAGNFKPYEREGEVVRTRRDLGRYTHLRYEFTVRCLTYACLPKVGGGPPQVQPGGLPAPVGSQGGGFGERKTVKLKAARVLYDDPEGSTRVLRNVAWPAVQAVSRLNFGDTAVTGIGFPFEASVTPLPEASYRVSPALLGAGLLLGALALLALPAILVVRTLRREPPPMVEEEPELTPLERALELVGWARERSEAERRESLEALAVELELESSELTDDARRLAWSSTAPPPAAMGDLVESVREASGTSD